MTCLMCFSWCFAVWEFLCQMCPVLVLAEMSTEVTVPCVTHWPGFAYSRKWHLCKYASAGTPHILENFILFNDVVNQRKRLICISLRTDSVKMTRSNWITCLFSLLWGLFMQGPLGIPALAEAPVAPRSWPGTGTSALKPWAAAHQAGCAEQDFPCPKQKLPSPTASPGQSLYYVLALVSFCSWLVDVQFLADFFPLFCNTQNRNK